EIFLIYTHNTLLPCSFTPAVSRIFVFRHFPFKTLDRDPFYPPFTYSFSWVRGNLVRFWLRYQSLAIGEAFSFWTFELSSFSVLLSLVICPFFALCFFFFLMYSALGLTVGHYNKTFGVQGKKWNNLV